MLKSKLFPPRAFYRPVYYGQAISYLRRAAPLILGTALLFFLSCNSGNGEQNKPAAADSQKITPAFDASLKTGQVADTVVCRNNSGQSYALYLPAGYTNSTAFPCIYFFDAHARGSLPVRRYKDIAERYGFVLVASNNSQNGMAWPETNSLAKTMMEDVQSRVNIDTKRIYTSGFSGGSRVAASIALLDGGVAGVLGAAAGFPQLEQAPQGKFDYFGIVGCYDFNFTEMAQLDKTLEQSGFVHQLLTSSGIHGWPSAKDFETGLLWLQVNAMKEHLQPVNDALINALASDMDKRVAAAISAKDWIAAHDLLAGAMRVLNGLKDATQYSKQLADVNNGVGYKSAAAAEGRLQQDEAAQQREIQQLFAAQNEQQVTNKIKLLNQNARTAKAPQEAQMNKRIVSFAEFVAYMYTDHALKADDAANADKFLKIFKIAGPENPDYGYLSAALCMLKGDSKQAIAALNEAAALGYDDVAKLINDPVFRGLAGDEGFQKVVARVRENYKNPAK